MHWTGCVAMKTRGENVIALKVLHQTTTLQLQDSNGCCAPKQLSGTDQSGSWHFRRYWGLKIITLWGDFLLGVRLSTLGGILLTVRCVWLFICQRPTNAKDQSGSWHFRRASSGFVNTMSKILILIQKKQSIIYMHRGGGGEQLVSKIDEYTDKT